MASAKRQILPIAADEAREAPFQMQGRVAGIMLFPDDPDERQVVDLSVAGIQARDEIAMAQRDGIPMPAGLDGRTILAFAFNAPRAPDDFPRMRTAIQRGLFCREVLFDILERQANERAVVNVGDSIARVNQRLQASAETQGRPKRRIGTSVDSIYTHVWPVYRPVVHLWAATFEAWNAGSDIVLPCDRERFDLWLRFAEGFRLAGERFRPKQASMPLLRAEEAWRMPDGLVQEPFDVLSLLKRPTSGTRKHPGEMRGKA